MNFKTISILVVVALVTFAIVKREAVMQFIKPTEAYTPVETTHQGRTDTPMEHTHDENCNHEKQPNEQDAQEEQKHPRHEVGTPEKHPYYQGEVVSVKHGAGYTYLEIKEKTDLTFWVALERVDAKVGDYVMFQKQMIARNFKSTVLNRTFDEIMFASNLQYKVKE
jgi:hypothetical protein